MFRKLIFRVLLEWFNFTKILFVHSRGSNEGENGLNAAAFEALNELKSSFVREILKER